MAEKYIPYNDSVIASKATIKYAPVPARKVRLVIDLLRYKTVAEAEEILQFTPKPSVVPVLKKLLDSAKANVPHGEFPHAEDLVIGDIRADVGPQLKRIRPRARGRATWIRKRMCHISIRLMPPLE